VDALASDIITVLCLVDASFLVQWGVWLCCEMMIPVVYACICIYICTYLLFVCGVMVVVVDVSRRSAVTGVLARTLPLCRYPSSLTSLPKGLKGIGFPRWDLRITPRPPAPVRLTAPVQVPVRLWDNTYYTPDAIQHTTKVSAAGTHEKRVLLPDQHNLCCHTSPVSSW
jgi:hypothetical protein